jgi:uncharacterized protein (TIGR00369 family)
MNPFFEFFKSNIGQKLAKSPSELTKWLDGTLLAVEEGSLTVEFDVRPDMCNPGRILHGGIATTLMDDVIGMTVASMGMEYFYSSINLSVDFLYAVPMGGKVTVKSQLIRAGKKVINIEAKVYDEAQRVIAKCTSNMGVTSQKFNPK